MGNKYESLAKPQATLDYHGRVWRSESEIKGALDRFILECRSKGFLKVLVVTGKGLHSENGAVVKPIVLGYLKSRDDIKSVVDAPENQGGAGALMVTFW